jgi:predicted transposase YbfD/YdcC
MSAHRQHRPRRVWFNTNFCARLRTARNSGTKATKQGRTSSLQCCYLVSLPADAKRFGDAVWQHWGGEDSLHWALDVSCNEDTCRIRKDQGAQTFSVLRHIALNLLKRESQHKRGIKVRRKRAGWDRDYLLQVLSG